MDGHKGPGHGRIARQKQRPAFFDDSGKLVTDGVDTQIRTVVTHSDNYKTISSFNIISL